MGTTTQAMDEAYKSYSSSQFDTAIVQLNSILKTDLMPTDRMSALQLLSNCFSSQGDFKAALIQHEKILDLDPKNYVSLFTVAMIHRDLQNYPKSIYYFKAILEFEPNNVSVKYNLALSISDFALVLKIAGKLKESEDLYKESIAWYPQNPQSYYNVLNPCLTFLAGMFVFRGWKIR
jgi:tetratricopeptide (TPR) repeat protein